MKHNPTAEEISGAKLKRAHAWRIWIVTEPPDSRNLDNLPELREVVFRANGDVLQQQFVNGLVGSSIVGFYELQADADEHGRFLLEQQRKINEIRKEV